MPTKDILQGRDVPAMPPGEHASLPAASVNGGAAITGGDGHPIKTVVLPKSASHGSNMSELPEGLGKRTAIDTTKMVVANPTPDVGALGYVFFTWMDHIVQLGYQRNKGGDNLEHKDLWELQENLRAQHVVAQFETMWAEEQATSKAAGKKASLSNVFWKLTKPWIMASAGFELLRMSAQYASPMVIKQIILYIQKPVQEPREGITLIVILLLSSVFVALGKSHAFHKALSGGLVTKAACNSLVYRKVLKLSPSARQKYSSGNIVNLMATDSERMFQSFMSVNALWAAPLGLITSLAMMYSSVKNATWFCLIALFAVFFALAFIFMRISRLERLRLEAADVRVKVLNEMMQGIKVIKLMGWEEPIRETCDKSRECELVHVRGIAITKALMIAVVLGSSVLAAVVTFSVYVAMYPDEGMNPENIFVAAILINMLRFPLMQIPEAISAYARIKESFRRMQELLECDEMEPVALLEAPGGLPGDTVMSITNGKFVWELEKTAAELEEEAKKKELEKKQKARENARKKKQDKDKADDAKSADKKDAVNGTELAEVAAADEEDKPYVWSGPTLQDINLDIKKGELVMITGRVGSGKSSLLAALLGEINKLEGEVRVRARACMCARRVCVPVLLCVRATNAAVTREGWVREAKRVWCALLIQIPFWHWQVAKDGHVAYVPQTVWIRNATLKDNVTFSTPFEEIKFNATLRACALDTDIKILPAGYNTEIGERGINLSGGQKARVQLARAVYCGADIFLLDDPLSAVDTHVARRLMDECLLGVLKDMTRVLVTHQIQFLSHADKIIVLDGGKIVAQGKLEDVQAHIDLSTLHHVTEDEHADNQADAAAEDDKAAEMPKEDKEGKLVTEEERDKGAVGMEVYLMYFKAWGHWAQLPLLILIFMVAQTCTEGNEVWLAWWSMDVSRSIDLSKNCWGLACDNGDLQGSDCDLEISAGPEMDDLIDTGYCNSTTTGPPIKELLDKPKLFWNLIYAGLAIGSVMLTTMRGIYFQTRGIKASRRMVRDLITSVLGGTMAFFDVTPSGRILNRFSADTDRLDTQLTNIFENYLGIGAWIVGALILVCVLLPWFAIPFIPLCLFYKLTEMYFTPTARELQRLEAVSRSPMVSHFTETVSGASTIRAFNMCNIFEGRALEYLDVNLRPVQLGQEARRWLDQRLEVLNVFVQFFTALFCLLAKDSLSPTYAGLALHKALSISSILSFLVMMRTFLETSMNAVERIHFYTHEIQQESQVVTTTPAANVEAAWPRAGSIEFKKYCMRYRPGLPLVLRDLSLSIAAGEKVGIVGRTGSGKSSMLAALFRLVEGDGGQILIDGADIAGVPLKTLRSVLSIIPQDPVLFSGTLRYNLDPFRQYPDSEVHDVLKCAQLEDLGSLDKEITESGENLSMGQRQLVALARVLLRKPRVLMLDEATASVDMETDAHIQNIIKQRILSHGQSTLLVIAHRLSTIVDSSRVLVMEQGQTAEFATPKALLSDSQSVFSQMVDKMGPQAAAGLRAQCGVSE